MRIPLHLLRSETTKLFTAAPVWILGLVAILGTWPMAWANATASVGVASDDPRLFSAEPVPAAFQGFEMAGFGGVLVVALGALWAGSEYGAGGQIRTTLLASPNRLSVFGVKAALLTVAVAAIAFLTMWGTSVITHLSGDTGVDPWSLSPAIWAHLGGVSLAWAASALLAFALGVLARSAVLPLILLTPLVIGVGDFLGTFWEGAKYLPVVAGTALYSDPASGLQLPAMAGGLIQVGWALLLLGVAAVVFARRDL